VAGQRAAVGAGEFGGYRQADAAYPTVEVAIAKGRNIDAQLRGAVAFYLGAKLALVAVMLIPLAAGLAAPFAPVHIVLLELFMDLGASPAPPAWRGSSTGPNLPPSAWSPPRSASRCCPPT
jgi:Ca2+-transporting ATPase